jgi:hypothetical protein
MELRPILLLAAAVLPLRAAVAQPPAAEPWGVQQMMAAMAAVRAERAYFEEEKHFAILQQALHSTGQLAYRAPSYVLKQTLTPQFESLEVDGDWLLTIDSEQAQRRLYLPGYPLLQALVESVRSTMAGDLNRLAQFYTLAIEGGPDDWILRLTPLQPDTRQFLAGVIVRGRDNRIATVETLEADGDRSVMTVSIISIE